MNVLSSNKKEAIKKQTKKTSSVKKDSLDKIEDDPTSIIKEKDSPTIKEKSSPPKEKKRNSTKEEILSPTVGGRLRTSTTTKGVLGKQDSFDVPETVSSSDP